MKTWKHYLLIVVTNHYQSGWCVFCKKINIIHNLDFLCHVWNQTPQVVGMNAILTRWGLCCIPICWRTSSYNTSSWSKSPSNGVWTTFSNAYNSTWWPCSYKCNNFPSMPTKTIVQDINFYAPYIQIYDINIHVKKMINLSFT